MNLVQYFVLTSFLVSCVPIGVDNSCKDDLTNCEYTLKCLGPMTQVRDPSNVQWLCVDYPVCDVKTSPKVYYPEHGGPAVDGKTFFYDDGNCTLSKNKGEPGE